jgi:NDP-sugar pyrophosphorylase family protein
MIERLRDAGFRSIWMIVNYKGNMIRDHFGTGAQLGVEIDYMFDGDEQDDHPRGTAGKLRDFDAHGGRPFLVMNADILTRCNFGDMLEFHERHSAAITVGMVPYTVEVPFGVLEVDGERLIAMREKQAPLVVNAGIYVLQPSVLDSVRRWQEPRLDMPGLIERIMSPAWAGIANVTAQPSKVVAFLISEYWLDVGRPDDLEKARRDFPKGLLE